MDVDQDVVMDGTADAPSIQSANGYSEPTSKSGGSSLETPNGHSADSSAEGTSSKSGELGYPERFRRKGILPTGCCYDDRMKLHANADFGPNPHHPEDPSRIEVIMRIFKKHGLLFTGTDAELIDVINNRPTSYMWRIPAREATEEEIRTVHRVEHFNWVKALSTKTTHELRDISAMMDQGRESLYVGSMTYEASLISAGGAIETCKAVVTGTVKNAFAVIRPPGHHAEYDQPMGFCLFNNVPIAAKVCQKEYPDICRRVMILDWDVHHGNGIQNMFYEDPNILYISLHVYKNGDFYPGKPDNPMIPDGGMEQCGAGNGLGKNINIAWHDQGMGDGEYMAAFQKIVMPIGHEFNPDLVIISAGFDAAAGDELGACFVSPACYAHMTHMLMSLAGGKVAVCLEGGYNLIAISKSALAVAQTLMGEPPPQMQIPRISKEASKVLAKVQAYQAPYWECMRPGIIDVTEMTKNDSSRLHDVIRSSQKEKLSKYGMLPLYIQRDIIFRSFENQVLVTKGVQSAKKLLLIVHDPPELHGQPDPLDNSLEPHNSWVSDGVAKYIDWACNNDFGVIDINVPHYITRTDDTEHFTPRMDEKTLQMHLQELMCYIWDNYLQLYDGADEIYLMGVGNAYLGIKVLLINRNVRNRIAGIVNFVDGSLRPVKSDVDEDLSSWYKDNSQVYVANDHACWSDPDLTRKVMKRRFGNAIRSEVNGLAPMMNRHFKDVLRFIAEQARKLHGGETTEDEGNRRG